MRDLININFRSLSKPLHIVETLFTDVDNKLFEDLEGTINIIDFDIDDKLGIVNPKTQIVEKRETLEQLKPYTLQLLKNLLHYERGAPQFKNIIDRINAIVNNKPPDHILPKKDIVEIRDHKVPNMRKFKVGDVVQGNSDNTYEVTQVEEDKLIFANNQFMKKEKANIVMRGLVTKENIPAGTLITLYPTDELIQKQSKLSVTKQKTSIGDFDENDFDENTTYQYMFDAGTSETSFRIHVRPSKESIENPMHPYLGHLVNGIRPNKDIQGFVPIDPGSNCFLTEFYSKSLVGVFALIDIKKGTPLICSYSENYIF